MDVKGLAHAHVRIAGGGLVVRLPRSSYFGLAAADNIAYQAECFRRAAASGASPALFAAIPPAEGIPNGALVVEEIVGRTPRVPADMAKIAEALARLHALPLPPPAERPPLRAHDDPVAATLAVIEAQAAHLAAAGLAAAARQAIEDELAWARAFAAASRGRDHPIALVGSDTHPGNFLIDGGGRAVFVDVERMVYGSPAIDLAHASVYTSTMWDADVATSLARRDIEAFYRAYLARAPRALARRLAPWLAPLRRLTWLRTTTWCAKWRVETAGDTSRDPDYLAMVRARIADYFDPATIARIRAEWLDERPLDLGG
jgi:hypothetical protein